MSRRKSRTGRVVEAAIDATFLVGVILAFALSVILPFGVVGVATEPYVGTGWAVALGAVAGLWGGFASMIYANP